MQGLVVWAKNMKLSGSSSVSRAPVETDGGGDGGGNLGVGNDVVVVVGTADRYRTRGLGVWAKNPKTSSGCSVSGVPVETIGGANGGGRGCVVNEVVVVVGTADQYCAWGLGIWAKNPKPSGGCSVLGAPVENDGRANGGGMLGVGNEVVELVERADQYRTRGLGV
jgi:hypothetical protein